MLKKFLTILGLIAFFGIDDVLLVILFFKIGFPHLALGIWIAIVIFVILLNVSLALVVYRVMLRRPTTGVEGLSVATGVVVTAEGRKGKVMVKGEHWDAIFTEDLKPGDEIRVKEVRGMTLLVERDKGPEIRA